jgi:hypothetical protein
MNYQMIRNVFLVFFILVVVSCLKTNKKTKDMAVAKVYDRYLYATQLQNIVPEGLKPEDSLAIVKDHIDKWIRNQLLLYQAEQYLSPEDKNVQQQIEDYRTSLLIFKYEQSFINEKLDTNIKEEEIMKYYNSYSSNFVLNNNLIKGIFIQVPRSAPEIYKIRSWYRSDDPENVKQMEQYCYNNATKFEYFEEDWKYFNEIIREMPELYTRPENILRYWKNYEMKDSTYYYFLKISDYRLEGNIIPLELVREDIRSILLNKRKIQLIQELESNIYNNALNRGNFTVYD